MELRRRWSFRVLLCLFFLAMVGPSLFSISPSDEVAPPFAKPLWLRHNLPPTIDLAISKNKGESSIAWTYSPPARLRLVGYIVATKPVSLLWIMPDRELFLLLFPQGETTLEIDGRDMAFKEMLGASPFAQVPQVLFPEEGEYTLAFDHPEYIVKGDLALHIEGGRWGALGTDQRGRDVLLLFIEGVRVSLIVGISATFLATFLGLSFGLLSGYVGGWLDALIMRGVDVLLSIPILPILMVLAAFWGKGLWQLVLILSLFSWMGTARTVRAMTLTLRDSGYIEGLRGLGAPTHYIVWRHLLPETLPLLLANIALGVPSAILSEAGISFLGLSDPRIISWGRMLHEAYAFGAFSQGAWWLLIPPGLGITLLCLVFLDLGKYLEERVDPLLKGEARS